MPAPIGTASNIYTLLGDGELAEGQIWEATMFSAHYKLDNLCIIVDVAHSITPARTSVLSASALPPFTVILEGNSVGYVSGSVSHSKRPSGPQEA